MVYAQRHLPRYVQRDERLRGLVIVSMYCSGDHLMAGPCPTLGTTANFYQTFTDKCVPVRGQ